VTLSLIRGKRKREVPAYRPHLSIRGEKRGTKKWKGGACPIYSISAKRRGECLKSNLPG